MSSALSATATSNLHDETLTTDGRIQPDWQRVMTSLHALSPAEVANRQLEISRQLRAYGVAYSTQSDARLESRPWHLDLAPFVIEPNDWATVSRALEQRAQLKRAILADVYANQRLLKDRLIPPAMIFAHGGYQRDAHKLGSEQELPMMSADISRSPSGQWYVVDDICQYPEGIGYAVENRLVLSRTLPKLFRESRVKRIATYFKQIQQHIADLSESDGRCVMLAYGPEHPYYFEYAFLAKYLGYTLVQCGDLTVRDNRVYLRTVAGLQRVSVIIRFIADTTLDPMAIGQASARGITGLFQAVRCGGVKVINPLGSGVLDNPALNICMPRLCKEILGEDLLMPGPPTYWLGHDQHRAHVMGKRDALLYRDIDSLGQLFDPQLMLPEAQEKLYRNIALTPHRYVAQERLDRSTAPAFNGTDSVKLQVTVRCFLVSQGDHYSTMPGGLCLLDTAANGSRPAYDALTGSKDTWIIAKGPVKPVSLLTQSAMDSNFSVIDGELPSRVAENLFWMGRHAERCETTVRLLRCVFQTLQNDDDSDYQESADETITPALSAILRATTKATRTLPGFIGRGGLKRLREPQKELLSLLHDPARAGTLPFALNQLQNSSSSARDRVSDELLHVLNQLDDLRTELVNNPTPARLFDGTNTLKGINNRLNDALLLLSSFAGLAHENFTHGDGWRFMMLGRRLERVQHTSVVINMMLARKHNDILLLETLLKLFDSVMTYRSRYRSQIDVRLVLRLLLVDQFNPRSLAFQLTEIQDTIAMLPGRRSMSQADELSQLVIGGLSRIQLADPEQLVTARKEARQNMPKLLGVLEELPNRIANNLTATYFSHVQTGQQLADLSPAGTVVGHEQS